MYSLKYELLDIPQYFVLLTQNRKKHPLSAECLSVFGSQRLECYTRVQLGL